ncbi:hypothetical protein [Bacillus sp. JCM 19034]|uniref:hypothetical protein n=1 Tax=Bacillus sp. JCM 19034 TaxID=1481928 RepID=UPI0009EAB411|nr:hypothetical protein [Bacillus sp. JCM 19034]
MPYLFELGFKGKIYSTSATIEQTIQVLTSLKTKTKYFETIDHLSRRTWITLLFGSGIEFQYGYSGHTLGSVWYLFRINKEQIYFSGDYSTESPILLTEQPIVEKPIDIAILDGAYGKETRSQQSYLHEIYETIEQARKIKRKVLIHGPMYGKLQDLLISLLENKPDLFSETVISQDMKASFAAYINAPANVKKKARLHFKRYSNFVKTESLINWLRISKFSIGLFSEQEVLKNFTKTDNLLILCTGPFLQDLVHVVNKHDTIDYEQKRYKVHPCVNELHEQMKRLQPKKVIFTHNSNEQMISLQETFTELGEDVALVQVGEVLETITTT